jgi:membrane-anchored protein YejM (alkaline phosphatase superfamily)
VIVFLADVKLASDDGLDADLVRRIYEMHRAKNVAVVRHRDRRHAEFMNPLNKFFDVASAIEQRVIAVEMQVNEFSLGHEVLGREL